MKRVIAVLVIVLMSTQPAIAQDTTPPQQVNTPPAIKSHFVFVPVVMK